MAGIKSILKQFEVHPERGFLPRRDPLARLPKTFAVWEELATRLPKSLVSGHLRAEIDRLPLLDAGTLQDERQWQRAMLLLSYLGHAYVWGEAQPATRIPAGLAVPWQQVARRLGRLPVLSYASYALYNWRRVDPRGPVALGNIVLLQNFLGGIDEEWFILVHVDIESKAGSALAALVGAREAVKANRPGKLQQQLEALGRSLQQMFETLCRMPERCDPYIYYHRVRPYIHGWKNNPALPDGLVYEGVTEYGGRPQKFAGETGAQSSIVPALDGALGIAHKDDPLRPYLMDMRNYMPPAHRAFIEATEQGPSLRQYVIGNKARSPALRVAYNDCVSWIDRFRSKHLEYAANYIQKQSQDSLANPTAVGTGSTPFMAYLKKHREETAEHLID